MPPHEEQTKALCLSLSARTGFAIFLITCESCSGFGRPHVPPNDATKPYFREGNASASAIFFVYNSLALSPFFKETIVKKRGQVGAASERNSSCVGAQPEQGDESERPPCFLFPTLFQTLDCLYCGVRYDMDILIVHHTIVRCSLRQSDFYSAVTSAQEVSCKELKRH